MSRLGGDESLDDLECTECGYSLRGLKIDGACPECGTSIARTLRAGRSWIYMPVLIALNVCKVLWVMVLLFLPGLASGPSDRYSDRAEGAALFAIVFGSRAANVQWLVLGYYWSDNEKLLIVIATAACLLTGAFVFREMGEKRGWWLSVWRLRFVSLMLVAVLVMGGIFSPPFYERSVARSFLFFLAVVGDGLFSIMVGLQYRLAAARRRATPIVYLASVYVVLMPVSAGVFGVAELLKSHSAPNWEAAGLVSNFLLCVAAINSLMLTMFFLLYSQWERRAGFDAW